MQYEVLFIHIDLGTTQLKPVRASAGPAKRVSCLVERTFEFWQKFIEDISMKV